VAYVISDFCKELFMRIALTFALIIGLFASTALAQSTQLPMDQRVIVLETKNGGKIPFSPATPETLSKAYIRLSMVDLKNDRIIDDFAALNLCKLFKRYYSDEFAWREARIVIRKIIERTSKSFPIHMVMHSTINLGRYNFSDGVLEISERDVFKKVGIFNLTSATYGDCLSVLLTTLPDKYVLRLTNPINLSAIPLGEASAYRLLNQMKREKNENREVYISFFIKLNDFISNYSQIDKDKILSTEARGTLVSLRFFADRERTSLIYDYIPPVITGPGD
jgi:Domain of unknown function (DUF4852)